MFESAGSITNVGSCPDNKPELALQWCSIGCCRSYKVFDIEGVKTARAIWL